EWSITHNAIIIAASDPGPGPSDEMLNSPSLPQDPTSESGRGLFILASFADEFRYWRGPRGFTLEVVKYYPSQGLPLPGNPEIDSIIDELSSCYESLSVFHRLTENLIESGNLRDFIGSSLDEFLALHPLDRIFFLGAPTLPATIRTILSNSNWFLDQADADPTLKCLGSLTRETVWESFEDLTRQNLAFQPLRAVGAGCVFPIVAGDIHFGALIALRKPAVTEIQRRSLGTLRTLADLCGIACANAHLSSIRDESQRDLHELEIAVEIQKELLPILPAPISNRWQVSIYQESSLTIAGDYAMAELDEHGNLVVAMIDVMGKGVSAALLASIFRTAFGLSLHIPTASGMLETINRTLCKQLGDLSMFITCAIARVSADGKSLNHSSAGHCPTFVYKPDGSRTFFSPSGPPLGILPKVSYANDHTALVGGERFAFITDGCYEWDRRDEDFGWQRFVEHMDLYRHAPPQELWTRLRDRIRAENGENLEDDCTLVTLDILP
ncbi:SpoIIE family protein phosphatase, partial [bacterium]|nr:SpoIIE family protein phosphatase [bacterium]